MHTLIRHRISIIAITVLTTALIAVPMLALGGDDAHHIAQANAKIEQIVDQATHNIQQAPSYDKMQLEAQKAEARVFDVVDKLEQKIGDVDFKPFYVTVCNDEVDQCVTFDPVRITGSGKGA